MFKIARLNFQLVYSTMCDNQFSKVKVLNCCGKFRAVQMANNLINTVQDIRNSSDEVTPVGCQIFSSHEKNRGSTVKDSLK